MTQGTLFDGIGGDEKRRLDARRHSKPGPPEPVQRDNEKALILRELRKGPVTNHCLNELCMSYRQRISDLRKDGYRIVNRKLAGRVSLYELK